ncbi:MAG: hypothetical protein QXF45_05405 [Candidatus Caldarchaeum sp.]|uniref:MIP18 family-like domain-containing protein n=1 Tax=Caldiarchaeum subterraneum TaxID=311458 RepID=A0A7C5Y8H7_CALS0
MQNLSEKVRQSLARLKDPVSNAPILFLEADIEVKEVAQGEILVLFYAKDPYSPNVMTYADAVKKIASKVEGVKRVVVDVRNHVMSDLFNIRVND